MGEKHPNFKPFVMNPYLLCEIRMSVLHPVEPNKKMDHAVTQDMTLPQ